MGFSNSFKEVNIHGITESVMRFVKIQFGKIVNGRWVLGRRNISFLCNPITPPQGENEVKKPRSSKW